MIGPRTGARRWARCAGAGTIALLASLGFGQIAGLQACGGDDAMGAIIAFELVRTPGEVAALFGAPPCRDTLLAAMRQATWIDAIIFIPAYTAFLILALASLKRHGLRLARVGMAFAALGGLIDQIEGGLLFAIMRALPGDPATIGWLIPMVRGKFVLLGLATAIIGLLALRLRGLAIAAGALIAAGGFAGATLLLGDRWIDLTLTGVTIAWPVLLALAIWQWIDARGRAKA